MAKVGDILPAMRPAHLGRWWGEKLFGWIRVVYPFRQHFFVWKAKCTKRYSIEMEI